VRISGPAPVPVEIDGDEGGETPVEIQAGGVAVHFIVPPVYVADLR
jgi:diacylglycerol kinase family enzyme